MLLVNYCFSCEAELPELPSIPSPWLKEALFKDNEVYRAYRMLQGAFPKTHTPRLDIMTVV